MLRKRIRRDCSPQSRGLVSNAVPVSPSSTLAEEGFCQVHAAQRVWDAVAGAHCGLSDPGRQRRDSGALVSERTTPFPDSF